MYFKINISPFHQNSEKIIKFEKNYLYRKKKDGCFFPLHVQTIPFTIKSFSLALDALLFIV